MIRIRTLQPEKFPEKFWNREGTILRKLVIGGTNYAVVRLDTGDLLYIKETDYETEDGTVDLTEMLKWILKRFDEGEISKLQCESDTIKSVCMYVMTMWGKEKE